MTGVPFGDLAVVAHHWLDSWRATCGERETSSVTCVGTNNQCLILQRAHQFVTPKTFWTMNQNKNVALKLKNSSKQQGFEVQRSVWHLECFQLSFVLVDCFQNGLLLGLQLGDDSSDVFRLEWFPRIFSHLFQELLQLNWMSVCDVWCLFSFDWWWTVVWDAVPFNDIPPVVQNKFWHPIVVSVRPSVVGDVAWPCQQPGAFWG